MNRRAPWSVFPGATPARTDADRQGTDAAALPQLSADELALVVLTVVAGALPGAFLLLAGGPRQIRGVGHG
jgi:hypothetical protein